MAKITQKQLIEVLEKRLKLKDPKFKLENLSGGKLAGSVISDTFMRMEDSERQKHIWDALEDEFGDRATQLVSTLLAYTDAEWNQSFASN